MDVSQLCYACTVRLALWNIWSLVPTLILKTPGSTTHEFWSDHTASCEESTLIDTVADLPALRDKGESDVTKRVLKMYLRNIHFLEPD
jgi:hypothetical protein